MFFRYDLENLLKHIFLFLLTDTYPEREREREREREEGEGRREIERERQRERREKEGERERERERERQRERQRQISELKNDAAQKLTKTLIFKTKLRNIFWQLCPYGSVRGFSYTTS
jgi:hypothetical protein